MNKTLTLLLIVSIVIGMIVPAMANPQNEPIAVGGKNKKSIDVDVKGANTANNVVNQMQKNGEQSNKADSTAWSGDAKADSKANSEANTLTKSNAENDVKGGDGGNGGAGVGGDGGDAKGTGVGTGTAKAGDGKGGDAKGTGKGTGKGGDGGDAKDSKDGDGGDGGDGTGVGTGTAKAGDGKGGNAKGTGKGTGTAKAGDGGNGNGGNGGDSNTMGHANSIVKVKGGSSKADSDATAWSGDAKTGDIKQTNVNVQIATAKIDNHQKLVQKVKIHEWQDASAKAPGKQVIEDSKFNENNWTKKVEKNFVDP